MFSWYASAQLTRKYYSGAALRTAVLIVAVALGLSGMLGAISTRAAAGDLDPSFGNAGKVTTQFDSNSDQVNALAIQADGKIVAVGQAMPPCNDLLCLSKYAIARYNPNGSLDTSFGTGGKVVTNLVGDWSDESKALAVVVQADGKLLVAGTARNPDYSRPTFALVRYNPDGSVDTTFATNGVVLTAIDPAVGCCLTEEAANAVAIQTDGKILLAGTGGAFPARTFALVRYNADGTLDLTFGSGGKVATGGAGDLQARGLAVQPDGRILVGGNSGSAFAVARYTTNGALDQGFGVNGMAEATPALGGEARGLVLRPNGKIALGGWANLPPIPCGQQLCEPKAFALVQYNSDGRLDTSFGGEGTGKVVTYFIGPGSTLGYALARLGDDRLTMAGYAGAARFAVVIYNPDGSVDTGFGDNGLVQTSFGAGIEVANAVSVQADGKIIAAGQGYPDAGNPDDGDFALARYNAERAAPPPTATPTPGGCEIHFSDVNPTDYFYEPVRYMYCHGIISGYGDNTFRPGAPATRGQLSKIIVNAEGWTINTTGGPHFSDVPPSNPFYSFIETAYNRGVVNGYSDGSFRWGAEVTRGQLSKIIVNAQGWAINTAGGPHFSDVPPSNPFYSFIETAYNHGSISGYSDNTFRWGNAATRGQISKIVYFSLNPPAHFGRIQVR